jgi:probable phosphoglycerate mutase
MPENVIVEADGGSRGNPGPAGFGALLRDADTGDVLADAAEFIGRATNNVAEYRGLIAGLELYQEHTPDALLEVRMDSKLVIEQMAGRWKIKHPDMRPLAIEAQRLAPFGTVWTWVPREQNQAADRLANVAMDLATTGEVAGRVDSSAAGRSPADPTPAPDEPPSQAPTLRNPMLGWSGMLGEPTTFVLVRHGETIHTMDKKFSGPGGDDPGLTDEGWAQARRAAAALAGDDEPYDALLCSPLRRTRETAEAVASSLGLEVEIVDGFREAAFGDWDGLTLEQVAEKWPAELDQWLGSFEAAPPGGGESIVEVRARVEEALVDALERLSGQRVVVVSHVNPIKLAVRYCLGAELDVVNKMLLAPASLTTISFFDSGATALRQFSAIP